jgi:hypothetical protein
MKWINLIITTVGIGLLLNSCNDKKSDDFFAGKTSNIFYLDIEPDIILPIGENKDSIDINQDSNYDLFFETKAIPGRHGFFSFPAVKATQDLNILIAGENNMPQALSNGDLIRQSDKWFANDSLLLLYDCEYYGSNEYCTIIGFWADQEDKYLGFRYKNKLGWIKMTTTINAELNQCLVLKELGIDK